MTFLKLKSVSKWIETCSTKWNYFQLSYSNLSRDISIVLFSFWTVKIIWSLTNRQVWNLLFHWIYITFLSLITLPRFIWISRGFPFIAITRVIIPLEFQIIFFAVISSFRLSHPYRYPVSMVFTFSDTSSNMFENITICFYIYYFLWLLFILLFIIYYVFHS